MIHIVKQNFFFWLTVAALHIVIAAPAFAQMGGSTYYSDAWGDDNNLYGVGVTEDYYNSYNHTFRAVTTMQSPLGRVSSYDTGYDSSAVAYVGLSFDENDTGIYTVNSNHFNYCENILREISLGSTSAAVKAGVSLICYDWYGYNPATDSCFFMIQSNCPVNKCKVQMYTRPKEPGYYCPNKVQVKYLWTEIVNGCSCELTCTKTSDAPLYDNSPCNCAQIPPD